MRVFTRCGMQGVWLWVILRALQCVLQGYITNCLPFSGMSEARLEVGKIVVGVDAIAFDILMMIMMI